MISTKITVQKNNNDGSYSFSYCGDVNGRGFASSNDELVLKIKDLYNKNLVKNNNNVFCVLNMSDEIKPLFYFINNNKKALDVKVSKWSKNNIERVYINYSFVSDSNIYFEKKGNGFNIVVKCLNKEDVSKYNNDINILFNDIDVDKNDSFSKLILELVNHFYLIVK